MSETKPVNEQVGVTVGDVPHAPFIYFEEALTFGHANGLIRVTISAERATVTQGQAVTDQVVTAYLRTNIQGARALVNALNAALLAATPIEGQSN